MYVTGNVCKVVVDKGYAFIRVPGGADIFCHAGQLRNLEFDEQLTERRVRFEIDHRSGRPRAKDVYAAAD